jgi:putative ABC transport system permease protein
MTFRTLIRRSLRFHARSHLGVLAGATVGSAALIGALAVGDSVRETLRHAALARLGPIHFALSSQDRLFSSGLATRLHGPFASALLLPGTAAAQSGTARANHVSVLGVLEAQWGRLAGWNAMLPGFAQARAWFVGAGGSPFYVLQSSTVGGFFAGLGTNGPALEEWRQGKICLINETMARQLNVKSGDEIIVRVRRPTALALDVPLSPREDNSLALRVKVGGILPPEKLGDFALSAQPVPPPNVFISIAFLSRELWPKESGMPTITSEPANLLVAGPILGPRAPGPLAEQRTKLANWLFQRAPRTRTTLPANPAIVFENVDSESFLARLALSLRPAKEAALPDDTAIWQINRTLDKEWTLDDAEISVQAIELPQGGTGGEYITPFVQVTSPRIFLEPAVAAAALKPRSRLLSDRRDFSKDATNDVEFSRLVTNGVQVLTYLVNLIEAGSNAVPYSMVTAANGPYVPPDMREDEILVNDWLAEDLKLFVGDTVRLSYFVVDSGKRLIERTNSFRVRGMVPMKGIYGDRTLMPDFPGVAKAESTQDWDAGFPLTYKIRPEDEAYWKEHRGTPKAFITLAAGQAMWGSRFGAVTAIRFPVLTNSFPMVCCEAVYRNILANLKPEDVALHFEPVREQALKAADQAQDFGQLFLGFSFFLVIAALLLMALLFQFGLEQRAAEVGTLLALGFTPGQIRKLLLLEGTALALMGGVLGALGGLGYARAMLWGLATIWRDAVGASVLQFSATPLTLLIGIFASTAVAVFTIWLTLRKQARQPARELLAGEAAEAKVSRSAGPKSKVEWTVWLALAAGVSAVATAAWAIVARETSNAEVFFSAGSLLLIAGLAGTSAWLGSLGAKAKISHLTVSGLAIRGCARRRKRSVATVALLASGCFLIVAIGVFRLDANQDATKHSSGTGGFALLSESTLPIVQDLNTESGREAFGLGTKDLAGVQVVPFRVHDGDDASCLNLNRAQKPRLLGVNPEALADRFTFASAAKGLNPERGWELLRSELPDGEVPAIGDANSIEWALGKKIGETIDYTDERGQTFKLRLVGAVANSILQGNLLIDEAHFTKRFPNESGYRMFLLDAPSNTAAQVSAMLSRALQDVGLELTPTVRRLNAFNAVQNTYLGTFQVLGGLGLLLGSAGLGIVVLRNVLERRGELALLTAVGFTRTALQKLVLGEHGALLLLGLALGIISAIVAVLPAMLGPGQQLPWLSLSLTLGAVVLNGLLWTWLATKYAVRGDLLRALRNE